MVSRWVCESVAAEVMEYDLVHSGANMASEVGARFFFQLLF